MAAVKKTDGYEGKRVLVLGLARSGVSALRLLREEGAIVSGADENASLKLPPDLAEANVRLGGFDASFLDGCDEVIVSPGIAIDSPLMLEALARGIPLASELELGFRFAKGRIIAITGTNGKSTTVTMIGEILKAAGRRAIVCGNVGLPFCSVVRELESSGVFVLEVSSFQLETTRSFHPEVAGILNLTPDHLDRYHDVEDYYRFKARIIEQCGERDALVFNALDQRCAEIGRAFVGRKIPFSSAGPVAGGAYLDGARLIRTHHGRSESFLERGELGVPGLHNVENALAAVASVEPFDVPVEACRRALSEFTGLPHRMEKVGVVRDVTYYNDSKGTNVEATLMTLKGLDRPTVLIAGGHDKGGVFAKLAAELGHVKAIITIGEAAPLIEAALGSLIPITRARTMEEAVETAARTARPGELVLLSPACASFDMFRNFEHRGDVFRECVKELQR
jgi:UDP-N-acetylmuramoylalanine--D-glutamate ligase